MRNIGSAVTRWIEQITQPEDGHIDPKVLEVMSFRGGADALNPGENVNPLLVDTTVGCMTRFRLGIPKEEAFMLSMVGARILMKDVEAWRLMVGIEGLDDKSIINAVKLSGFSGVCSDPFGVVGYQFVKGISPDGATIENVRTMVERSCCFFTPRGSTRPEKFALANELLGTVGINDEDFMIFDTFWYFDTSEARLPKEYILQLLTYWHMGIHSPRAWQFQSIRYVGIYNPRLNEAYRLRIDAIPDDVITEVDHMANY